MGFHVICGGAEFLRQLRSNSELFLGAPYSFYVFVLATIIDDDVLSWLHKHEMQFDSLLGPYGAFFVFYNEARLVADRSRYFRDFEGTSEVEVDPITLEGGISAVDQALRYNRDLHTNKDILIKCMTYESDAIARELGLIDKIPCMVMFDDPSSEKYFHMPLSHPDDGTMTELRKLLSSLIGDPDNKEYMDLLRSWHSIHFELQGLLTKRNERVNSSQDINFLYTKLQKARQSLMEGKSREFRTTINETESKAHKQGEIPWPLLRSISNEAGAISSLIRSFRSGDISERRNLLIQKAQGFLANPHVHDPREATELLAVRMQEKVEEAIKLVCFAFNIPHTENLRSEWLVKLDERISETQHRMELIAIQLGNSPRPSLERHVQRLKMGKWAKSIRSEGSGILRNVIERGPSVLDALKKGFELWS